MTRTEIDESLWLGWRNVRFEGKIDFLDVFV
jgi:hypothetical protein